MTIFVCFCMYDMLLNRSGKDLSNDGILNVSDQNYRKLPHKWIKLQKAKSYSEGIVDFIL